MVQGDALGRLIRGAAAGLAGSLALQVLRTASAQFAPDSIPPIHPDPGEFMVGKAEALLPPAVTSHIPSLVEAAAAKGVAASYGMTAGAVYGLLRPSAGDTLVHGVTLGLGTWAVGYLGWLPALGLMPPVSQQDATEALGPVVRHALFGIVTVAAYRALSE